MWALRRAANATRSHSSRILVVRACFDKSETLEVELGNKGCYELDCRMIRVCCSPKLSLYGSSFSTKSLSFSQKFSSHVGSETSDREDELEDGFSDLEIPPETSVIEEVAGKEDGELSSAGEISDTESEGGVDNSLGSLDAKRPEPDSNDMKRSGKKNSVSPLFQLLLETPRLSFSKFLDGWVEEGNAMGRDEISDAMLNLRKRKLYGKALQFMGWLEANKRLNFLERDYASHLDLIAKIHGLQKAEKYIERIPESFRGEVTYRTLLANCVSATNVKKAEEIFNKMRNLGFPFTIFACNQLLLLYKRVDPKKIPEVLLMMEKENAKPSLFTYRLLIDAKGRSHDISGMEQILGNMKAEGVEPDLLIQALVAKHYIYGGLKEKAEASLKEIEDDGIKENHVACRELLLLYAELRRAEDVGRIWKVCEANPRVDECLSAITAFGKLNQIEDAERVFENMLKSWRKLTSKHFIALLKVYADHRLLSKGKDLVKRMSDSGVRIGPLTWDALVRLYVGAGEIEKADSILHKAAQQNQIKPLYSSYVMILEKYANRGDIHNAEKIFHRLKQIGYDGRMTQYRMLLQAYINAKMPAYGFVERMKADNMFPNKALSGQLAVVDAFKKTQISELLD